MGFLIGAIVGILIHTIIKAGIILPVLLSILGIIVIGTILGVVFGCKHKEYKEETLRYSPNRFYPDDPKKGTRHVSVVCKKCGYEKEQIIRSEIQEIKITGI